MSTNSSPKCAFGKCRRVIRDGQEVVRVHPGELGASPAGPASAWGFIHAEHVSEANMALARERQRDRVWSGRALEYADRVMVILRVHMMAGWIQADALTFSELHDHSDANMILHEAGVPMPTDPGGLDMIIAVQDEVEARLHGFCRQVRYAQQAVIMGALDRGWWPGAVVIVADDTEDPVTILRAQLTAWTQPEIPADAGVDWEEIAGYVRVAEAY